MNRHSKIKLVIGILVGVTLIGVITVVILSTLAPRNNQPAEQVAGSVSAKEVIEKIKNPASIRELSGRYVEAETSTSGRNDINYTKANSYMIIEPGTDFVQFNQKDVNKADNDPSVVSAISTFLSTNNLKKANNASGPTAVYSTFEGELTVCQVLTLQKIGTSPASLTVSCVAKTAIEAHYNSIDTLLARYNEQAETELKPTTIRTTTVTENNKTLTTLDVYGNEVAGKSLLFAAIDDSWEYIGERPLSTGTTELNPIGIDRTLSDEIRAKIANPKYDGFLEKHIR